MTNADVIRSKTDEKLADLFVSRTPFIDGKYSSRHRYIVEKIGDSA